MGVTKTFLEGCMGVFTTAQPKSTSLTTESPLLDVDNRMFSGLRS